MTDHSYFTVDPWPHQREGVERTIDALSNGTDSVCLTSPTGSGKTAMMLALTQWATERGKRVALFSNRILLTEQTQRVFQNEGVIAGVVAASMPHLEYEESPVQIASIQTVMSRRKKDPSYWLDADVVLADEVHQLASGESAELLNEYKDRGAKVIGVTATPLGVSNVCDELIVAAGTRDLQKSGHLCYARWFVGNELDTRKLTGSKADLSLSEKDARRTWGPLRVDGKVRAQIVGHIIHDYERFHPERIHTLAFAPGVKESKWAAQYCHSRGIRALHIDGKDFLCDGQAYDRKSADGQFQRYMQEWRDGKIPIIWNRFVMREGVDEPQIECIMLATPVGSYRSFLQMVGRGLRISEETPNEVKVIDLGGNYWRHGTPNIDVDWDDVFECEDADVLSKNRIAKLRETGESAGRVCPKCGSAHRGHGRFLYCQYCGHEMSISNPSRPIIRADGTLTEVNGEPIKQWMIKSEPGEDRKWAGLYNNVLRKWDDDDSKTHFSFNQLYNQARMSVAFGIAARARGFKDTADAFRRTGRKIFPTARQIEMAHFPPRDLKLMPENPNDWHRLVKDVDRGRLM